MHTLGRKRQSLIVSTLAEMCELLERILAIVRFCRHATIAEAFFRGLDAVSWDCRQFYPGLLVGMFCLSRWDGSKSA